MLYLRFAATDAEMDQDRARSLTDTLADIVEAARLLRHGELVAFPTETVYGLGGRRHQPAGRRCHLRGQGTARIQPTDLASGRLGQAAAFAVLDDRARGVATRFWPGPLTLVLPRRKDCAIALLASAGLDTVALRVPDHPIATASSLRRPPDRAPSANRSGASARRGEPCPRGARRPHRRDRQWRAVPGRCRIDGAGPHDAAPTLLRPGGVPVETLEAEIGPIERLTAASRIPTCPRHAGEPLRARTAAPPRRGFGAARRGAARLRCRPPPGSSAMLWLSRGGDLIEAAATSSRCCARSTPDFSGIAVMPIPKRLGLAINDRLRRAAAPRM